MFVGRKMPSIQNVCLLFPKVARKPKVTFLCLIYGEGVVRKTRNLITPNPRVFLFMDEGEHFIRLVMENKKSKR